MSMQAHVFNYNEPRIVLNSTRFVASLSKGASTVIGAILFIPAFVLMALYYPLLVLAMGMLRRESAKLLSLTRTEYKSLEYDEASEFLKKIEKTIKALGSIGGEDVASESVVLRPLIKRANQALDNFQEIEQIMSGALYIDTSKEEYTSKEKELFASLEDFFGDDPEVYEKDTFEQLKAQRAEV